MSEYKLENIEEDQIRFRFTDYKNSKRGERAKEGIREMAVSSFLDALLQHVPEKGYRMVRYYGLYSSRRYSQVGEEYKSGSSQEESSEVGEDWGEFGAYRQRQLKLKGEDPLYCHKCEKNYLDAGLVFHRPSWGVEYEDSS